MIGFRIKIVRHAILFVASRWLAAASVAAVACIAVSVCTADDRQTVTGRVADAQGLGVADLTVSAFAADLAARTDQPLATTSSDSQGRFTISLPAEAPLLVELQGDRGRGRVRVTPDELGQPLELVYPVRTTVVLLHDNDMHFNFNHREAFAAKLEQVRAEHEHVFLLNAGDIFVRLPERWNDPRPEYYAAQSRQIVDIMNSFDYDLMTLGNHELDYIEDLTIAALQRARFPLLSANVRVTTDLLPQPKPFHVLHTSHGLSIAVLGLSIAYNREGVQRLDPIDQARKYLYLREQHSLLVGLTHLGFRTDNQLAETLGTFDVIIGGHSHTMVNPAVTVNGVLIAQAAGTGSGSPAHPDRPKYLGQVTVIFENDQVVEKSGQVFTFAAPVQTAGEG